MDHTSNREMKNMQRRILKLLYPDYDARHHGVYVDRYNKDLENKALKDFQVKYGIIKEE